MYKTSDVLRGLENKEDLSIDEILAAVDHYKVYKSYIGDFKLGVAYNSPLREDKTPSFKIFRHQDGHSLLYKDFASGECGGVLKFIKEIENLDTYGQAVTRLKGHSGHAEQIQRKIKSERHDEKSETKITVQRREMTKADKEFWTSFGISESTLKEFKVSSISKYYINSKLKGYVSSEDELMFCYKIFNKFKIYRPKESKEKKWRGNLNNLDIQGFEQLPEKGDLLIITKSLKDVMVLKEMNISAIAPPSESAVIPAVVIERLRERFKEIIIFYDRDSTGMKFSRLMAKTYKMKFMLINKKHKQKDISDLTRAIGIGKAKKILEEMINK